MKVEGLAQDITLQVDAEKNYKRQNKELKKVNNELDQFVYKTVHDLRAPLTNLMGLLGLMRTETDRNILSSYFDLQEKSIERLDTFVQKITTYTKNRRLPISNQPLDLKTLIDNVLNNHNFITNSERGTKIVEIQKDTIFYGNEERISIILNNLVSNAVKFIDLDKEESTIKIKVTTKEDELRIAVWDNGQGIPKNIQPKIFDMFYRGSRQADGAGIGLYILKETVESLGGRVRLTSVPKEFTEFNIFTK